MKQASNERINTADPSGYVFCYLQSRKPREIALMTMKKSVVREPNAVRAGTRTTLFFLPGLILFRIDIAVGTL